MRRPNTIQVYVPTTNMTMAEQGTAHIPVGRGDDTRAITVTVIPSLKGKILPSQIIYTGKTEICLPKNATGKENVLFSYNEKHRSNEVETLALIDKIIPPYIENVKKELQVPNDHKSFLIRDAFKRQGIPRVQVRLAELDLGMVVVVTPKFMTHLLQPLDVSKNGTTKKTEKKEFSNYIDSIITNEMLINSSRDVTTIKSYLH